MNLFRNNWIRIGRYFRQIEQQTADRFYFQHIPTRNFPGKPNKIFNFQMH